MGISVGIRYIQKEQNVTWWLRCITGTWKVGGLIPSEAGTRPAQLLGPHIAPGGLAPAQSNKL